MPTDYDPRIQPKRFHSPLQAGDTEQSTVGCRHTSPDICRNNGLEMVCAFIRPDNTCTKPPKSWPRQYRKLAQADTGSEGGG